MFGNVRLAFGTILENLRKSLEGGRKSSESHQKRRLQHVYIIHRFQKKPEVACKRGLIALAVNLKQHGERARRARAS